MINLNKGVDKVCKVHGLTGFRLRKDKGYYICKKCASEMTKRYRKISMDKAYDYKGSKCERCGYSKCKSALEFHHRDPKEKDFSISSSQTLTWSKVKKEIDKCDLLCANCHREVHEELRVTNII